MSTCTRHRLRNQWQNMFPKGSTCTAFKKNIAQQTIKSGADCTTQHKNNLLDNAASKRKARSEGPRPRGPSGAQLREKFSSDPHFHVQNALWTTESTFSGTSVRQPKLTRTAHLVYHSPSYLQQLNLHHPF